MLKTILTVWAATCGSALIAAGCTEGNDNWGEFRRRFRKLAPKGERNALWDQFKASVYCGWDESEDASAFRKVRRAFKKCNSTGIQEIYPMLEEFCGDVGVCEFFDVVDIVSSVTGVPDPTNEDNDADEDDADDDETTSSPTLSPTMKPTSSPTPDCIHMHSNMLCSFHQDIQHDIGTLAECQSLCKEQDKLWVTYVDNVFACKCDLSCNIPAKLPRADPIYDHLTTHLCNANPTKEPTPSPTKDPTHCEAPLDTEVELDCRQFGDDGHFEFVHYCGGEMTLEGCQRYCLTNHDEQISSFRPNQEYSCGCGVGDADNGIFYGNEAGSVTYSCDVVLGPA